MTTTALALPEPETERNTITLIVKQREGNFVRELHITEAIGERLDLEGFDSAVTRALATARYQILDDYGTDLR